MTNAYYDEVASRVVRVREKMRLAAKKAGRDVEDITLVGVTKTQSAGAVRALLQAGVLEIGENRVQELLQKAPELADIPHKTHLIGHLQRNKAKFLPGQIDMLQSLDDEKTIEALERAYEGTAGRLDVLVEINIGDEASKTGIRPEWAQRLAERIMQSPVLRFRGLMAIPPLCEGDKVRIYFEQMYQLFIDIKDKNRDNNSISILSMGMSSDYEYAIMEGSTMVRIGTELFGPRQYA